MPVQVAVSFGEGLEQGWTGVDWQSPWARPGRRRCQAVEILPAHTSHHFTSCVESGVVTLACGGKGCSEGEQPRLQSSSGTPPGDGGSFSRPAPSLLLPGEAPPAWKTDSELGGGTMGDTAPQEAALAGLVSKTDTGRVRAECVAAVHCSSGVLFCQSLPSRCGFVGGVSSFY